MKAIFYFFYEITLDFSNRIDIIHVFVHKYKKKHDVVTTQRCLCNVQLQIVSILANMETFAFFKNIEDSDGFSLENSTKSSLKAV